MRRGCGFTRCRRLEEFAIDNLTTDGYAFINRSGTMPASHVFDLWVEIEE